MKKIIALALSILLGSVGYTIVDKTTDERISTLESQVSSLEELQSNNSNTTKTKANDIAIGDKLPFADNQPYQFTIKQIDYVSYNYDCNPIQKSNHTAYYDLNFENYQIDSNDEITNEIEHTIDIDQLEIIYTDSSLEKVVTVPVERYTTSISNEYHYTYDVKISGSTSQSLVGKYIVFRLYCGDWNVSYAYQPTVSALIKSDGSFKVDKTIILYMPLTKVLVGNVGISDDEIFIDKEDSQIWSTTNSYQETTEETTNDQIYTYTTIIYDYTTSTTTINEETTQKYTNDFTTTNYYFTASD